MRDSNFFNGIEGLGDTVPIGLGEEQVSGRTDAAVAAIDAAQAAGAPASPSVLDRIIGTVKSAISSDAFKALAPVIGAAVASKLTTAKTTTVKAAKPAPAPAKAAYTPAPAKAGLPAWVIPAGIGVLVLVGVGIFLKRKS
jgi:hypothetical protein